MSGAESAPVKSSPLYFGELGWGVIAAVAWMVGSLSAYLLLTGSVRLGGLHTIYLLFAVAVLVLFHAGFFFIVRVREDEGKRLSRRVPKYLEYAYAVVLCAGLAQIFFAAPLFKEYVDYVLGDDKSLLVLVRTHAEKHVTVDCAAPPKESKPSEFFTTEFFTADYCARMKVLHDRAQAADLDDPTQAEEFKKHLLETVAPDTAFLRHVTDRTVVTSADRSGNIHVTIIEGQSPITGPIDKLVTKYSYAGVQSGGSFGESIFKWFGLFFLPIAIALRVVKTSLELFVEMA